ncbi:hypothetical protein LZ753_11630 (plasmid) [Xylella fastidiosa subsp. fastidiosa]|nr:hypothetical protein LZ753_11630 [Xylella fastidiosa subsp. fastidiosa]
MNLILRRVEATEHTTVPVGDERFATQILSLEFWFSRFDRARVFAAPNAAFRRENQSRVRRFLEVAAQARIGLQLVEIDIGRIVNIGSICRHC